MGFRELFGGKSDGIAVGPTRGGLDVVRHPHSAVPLKWSELTKEQRKSIGAQRATKPAKGVPRTAWGSKQDFKKAKGK